MTARDDEDWTAEEDRELGWWLAEVYEDDPDDPPFALQSAPLTARPRVVPRCVPERP